MTRAMLTTAAIASLAAVSATAHPSQAAQTSPAPAVVVGCVAQMDNAFRLTTTASNGTRRWRGSNSAKSSTPVGGPNSGASAKGTSGSNSAKASTPVGTATTDSSGRRTGGVMTAKGSVPVRGPRIPEVYELQIEAEQLAPQADQMVEVRGFALPASEPAALRKLKVETLKVLSASCAR